MKAYRTILISIAATLLLSPVRPLGAQGATVEDATTARVASAKKMIAASSSAEALKAIDESEKALKAANAAATTSDSLTKLLKIAATTKPALADVASLAATGSRKATSASDEAVRAAATATETIKIDGAKAKAAQAVSSALLASRKAADGASKAEEARTKTANAADDASAREAAADVAKETATVAARAKEVAAFVAEAALQAARPSLPVTSEQDEGVLEALRLRLSGGSIFFSGTPEIIKSEDGKSATVRSPQFSQAAVYLAVSAEPRLFSFSHRGLCRPNSLECVSRADELAERGYDRVYIDPFIGIRMTTIPLVGATIPSSDATISAPSATVLQSQKAAQVNLGLFGSYNFGKFAVGERDFHWGVGPATRVIFQSVTDAQRATRVWNFSDDLYGATTVGMRVALFERDQRVGERTHRGWAPAAYLDFSGGEFQNFERAVGGRTEEATKCLQAPAACLTGKLPPENDFVTKNNWRMYIESRVFLQFLYLGFDLNNGSGPDDLRFIGGLTLKLDQFFTRRD